MWISFSLYIREGVLLDIVPGKGTIGMEVATGRGVLNNVRALLAPWVSGAAMYGWVLPSEATGYVETPSRCLL